jgi:hypothetical protein
MKRGRSQAIQSRPELRPEADSEAAKGLKRSLPMVKLMIRKEFIDYL